MKKYYALLFVSAMCSFVFGQTYVPFPTGQDSVAWKIASGGWGNISENFNYFLGDTLIDGYTYTKVYRGDVLFEEDSNELVDLVREENKQIFLRSVIDGSEYLLYDFGMQIGDSVVLEIENSDTLVLLSIDSVAIENNTLRKRFTYFRINEFNTDTVFQIEGLGNVQASFSFPMGFEVLDAFIQTQCIFSPNEVFYKHYASNDDCYKLKKSTPIKEVDKIDLLMYPNPTNDRIHFTRNFNLSSLYIYSISGQKVFEQQDFSGNQINISVLKTGVYYLKMEGEVNGFMKLVKL